MSSGPLEKAWALAHELGHLIRHCGYINPWSRSRQENQAERWAACALIPASAIRHHRNACEDSFIAALSKHYEDLPLRDCPQRKLAATIARIRLGVLQEEVA